MSPSSEPNAIRMAHSALADRGTALVQHCRTSLGRELTPALRASLTALSDEIVGRHGASSAATLVYGSCLWWGELDGVVDLFLLVDDYRSAYPGPGRAAWNQRLPPNVFPLFDPEREGIVRAKYAVLSLAHLRSCTRLECAHCFVWARLCQPAAIVFARDYRVRERIAYAAARSVAALVSLALALAADQDGQVRIGADLWSHAFAATYRAEWRFEAGARGAELVAVEAGYYDEALRGAVLLLEGEGVVEVGDDRVRIDPRYRRQVLRAWRLRSRTSKALAAGRLVKNAFLFGDWVPYALWKMERHTGVRLQPSAAQRRHPFLLGWPLLFQVLRRRILR